MNEAIANVAKHCYFDAAAHTWIYLDARKIEPMLIEPLKEKLLAHADYAVPLNVRAIKQPFEDIAVVLELSKGYLVFTVNCRDSKPDTVIMWSAVGHMWMNKDISNDVLRVVTVEFNPSHTAKKLAGQPLKEHNPDGKGFDELCVVEVYKTMPPDVQQQVIEKVIPLMAYIMHYIPCASEGLLQGEQIEYYRPSNLGNNAKRKRKGKLPMYEWRTVTLERKRFGLPSAPKGGTHASPRLHQRRGHWATSKLGKRYWRSEAVVGKAENGMIFHDYEDKKQTKERT